MKASFLPLIFAVCVALAGQACSDAIIPDTGLAGDSVLIYEPYPLIYNPGYAQMKDLCGATLLCPGPSCSPLAGAGEHPEITAGGGSAGSYVINTPRIDAPLRIVLRNDGYFSAEGLDSEETKEALSLAAQTWNYYANKDLFYYNVTADAGASNANGRCVVQFGSSVSGLGVTYTWMDGSGQVIKSNIVLSTAYSWTTDNDEALLGSKVDLQTVFLHELGHIVGMGDLYSLPSGDPRKTDYYQAMNLYTMGEPQHNLGTGDIEGVGGIYDCGTYTTTTSSTSTSSTATSTTTSRTASTTATASSATTSTSVSTTSTSSSTSTTSSSSSSTAASTTTSTAPTTSVSTTSTVSSTTSSSAPCALAGDRPPCGEIALAELVGMINGWSAGTEPLAHVVALLNNWRP